MWTRVGVTVVLGSCIVAVKLFNDSSLAAAGDAKQEETKKRRLEKLMKSAEDWGEVDGIILA